MSQEFLTYDSPALLNRLIRHSPDYFVAIALILVPFAWYPAGYVQVGGDASRLFLVWPDQWVDNISNGSRMVWTSGVTPVILSYLDPYIYLLKALTLNITGEMGAWLRGVLADSIKLGGSYLAMRALLSELIEIRLGYSIVIPRVMAICYALSPLIYVDQYFWSLPQYDQVVAYPALAYLFLKFLVSEKYIQQLFYLIFIFGIAFVFRHCFSPGAVPWLISAIIVLVPILSCRLRNAIIQRPLLKISILKFVLFFLVVFAAVASPLFADIALILDGNSIYTQAISGQGRAQGRVDDGFLGVAPHLKLMWPIFAFPQLNIAQVFDHSNYPALIFGRFYFLLSGSLLGLVLISFIHSKPPILFMRRCLLVSVTMFLIVVWLNSGGAVFRGIFQWILSLPAGSIWRYPPGKLGYSVCLTFFIIVSYACAELQQTFPKLVKNSLFFALGAAVLTAIPFLSGQIANQFIWQTNEKALIRFPSCLEETGNVLRKTVKTGRVLVLPLARGDASYHVMKFSDGMYVGASALGVLSGVPVIGSAINVQEISASLEEVVSYRDVSLLETLLSRAEIKAIIVDRAGFREKKSSWLWDSHDLHLQESLAKFIPRVANRVSVDDGICENYDIFLVE